MMWIKIWIKLVMIFLISGMIYSCKEKTVPKPEGYLRLEYPEPQYQEFKSDCPFVFQYSTNQSKMVKDSSCWYNVVYPSMKGKLYLTYYSLENNSLKNLIKQSEKLVYEHTIRAAAINPKLFINKEKKVFGTFFELTGESATNFQFYVTDSSKHFLQGSFYFRAQPKPDSLQPAVDYIKRDVFHLIESVKWK